MREVGIEPAAEADSLEWARAPSTRSPSTKAHATSGLDPAPAPPDLAHAYELLDSPDLRARFEGVRLLAELRPGEALPEILAFLAASHEVEPVPLQRLAAVALLGELEGIDTKPELEALYEESNGDDGSIRRAAACALEKRGDPSLVQRELSALRDDLVHPDGGMRARAVENVAELASRATVPVLLAMLADPNSEVRAQAVDGLWRADDPSVVPELERLLADPIERVRERARRAIRALNVSAAAPGVR